MRKDTFVSKSMIAAMFNVDTRSVSRWQDDEQDPLPVAIRGGKGKPNQYDIGAVHAWGVRRALAQIGMSDDGTVYDFQKERARLTHEQADKIELENAQLRGDLLPVGLLEQTLIEAFANIRAHLLAAPSNYSVVLFEAETVDEVRVRLTDAVYTILEQLSTSELSESALARLTEVAKAECQ